MAEPGSYEGYRPIVAFADWEPPAASAAWADFVAVLDDARAAATPKDLDRVVHEALRSAALETGAIEGIYATSRGVTRTVALQTAAWEAAIDEIGPHVRGHFEAQLDAMEQVLDVVTQSKPLTEVWIRELHAITCRAQTTYRARTSAGPQDHELVHGQYKTEANHVDTPTGLHFYCPPLDVPAEMGRLISEIRTPEFETAHCTAQAAYVHHAFTSIHPFADGNGRVARALASVFLYRAVGVPLVVFADQQERYWDALLAADLGNAKPFVQFIEDRTMDTMEMIAARLREGATPIESQSASIRSLFTAGSGMTRAELEAVGQRIRDLAARYISDFAMRHRPSDDVDIEAQHGGAVAEWQLDRPYHQLDNPQTFRLLIRARSLASIEADLSPVVGIADDPDERFTFIVFDANRPVEPALLLRSVDLHPVLTAAAELRLESWLRQAYGRALADFEQTVRRNQ